MDDKVIDGFFNIIHTNFRFLLDNTDLKNSIDPLFQTQLDLCADDLVFTPSLNISQEKGFYDLVDELVEAIFAETTYIPRLADHTGQVDYLVINLVIFLINDSLFFFYFFSEYLS